jgi:hypothetical protein
LPQQFDSFVFFDETSAVHELDAPRALAGPPPAAGLPETFPSGL